MLKGKRFAAAERQAELLRFVVEAALEGKRTDEDTIGYALFPYFKPDESSDVRVTAGNLRMRLDDYYAGEGRDDPVIISLPRPPQAPRGKRVKRPTGESYRPSLAFNSRYPVDQDYRRGLYYFSQCTPASDALALDHFLFALERQPDHAPSLVGKAEVFLRRAFYTYGGVSTHRNLTMAREGVKQALQYDSALWKAHVIQGALYTCGCEWQQAKESFQRALKEDEFKVQYGSWYYPAFLVALGHVEEGLSLVESHAKQNPDDLPAQLVYALFLYAARRFDGACYALATAQAMDPRQWIARAISALVALAQREPACPHIILVHQFVGEELLPGLLLLCYAADLRLREAPEKWGLSRRLADDLFTAIYRGLDEITDSLPSAEEQMVRLDKYAKEKYVSGLQLALAHLGLDQRAAAIQDLIGAFRESSPFMAWLHLWPVFDALRDEPGFEGLLRRRNPLGPT